MLTVLGGLTEFERDLIRAHTAEGRERAKARGVKLGRKPKLTPHQQLGDQAAGKRRAAARQRPHLYQLAKRIIHPDCEDVANIRGLRCDGWSRLSAGWYYNVHNSTISRLGS
jgi:DNA invertase Pin-like site-specific DNA recombinase